jgi:cytochrome b561
MTYLIRFPARIARFELLIYTKVLRINNRSLDKRDSFGWISILLHWTTAAFICVLWFIGDGIASLESDQATVRRNLHVSIAVTAYLLIWARIVWRLYSHHPQVHGQSNLTHFAARSIHYILLAAIAGMLCSGPIIMWSDGNPISVFGLISLPSPLSEMPVVNEAARAVHAFCGQSVLWLTVIHIGGALRHLMFHDDDTIARIFVPKRES